MLSACVQAEAQHRPVRRASLVLAVKTREGGPASAKRYAGVNGDDDYDRKYSGDDEDADADVADVAAAAVPAGSRDGCATVRRGKRIRQEGTG